MINIVHGDGSLSDFYKSNQKEDERKVFDENDSRKPILTYRGDGRKELDGIVQDQQSANALWSTTISRGVAVEWKDRSQGRLARAAKYLTHIGYETKVYIKEHNYLSTAVLFSFNLFLLYILYRLL